MFRKFSHTQLRQHEMTSHAPAESDFPKCDMETAGLTPMREHYGALVIGGGFYGCAVALAFARSTEHVAVLESEKELLTRASYANQARVHNGYHYPRSYLTALRSAANFPHFVEEFRECIDDRFEHVYAISKSASKVSASQFKRFCSLINAPLGAPSRQTRALLNTGLIEDAFSVTEYAFDADKLRTHMRQALSMRGVDVFCNTPVDRVSGGQRGRVVIHLKRGGTLVAEHAIACVYASTNPLLIRSGFSPLPLKHELAELALIGMPSELERVGVTVMDGPFFSTMPFPARELHSLSHVRYTPHRAWRGEAGSLPHAGETISPRYLHMVKDAQRYLPVLRDVTYKGSLFEVKSVLIQNEMDDGRPILFRKDYGIRSFSVIMGSKIDNIYDALKALEGSGLLESVENGTCVQ